MILLGCNNMPLKDIVKNIQINTQNIGDILVHIGSNDYFYKLIEKKNDYFQVEVLNKDLSKSFLYGQELYLASKFFRKQ